MNALKLALLVCLAGCGRAAPARNAAPGPVAAAAPAAGQADRKDVRKDDRYAVYDVVLDTFVDPDVRLLVIDNRSSACDGEEDRLSRKEQRERDETRDRHLARVRAQAPGLSDETVASYRSRPPVCLSPSFNLKVEYRLMSREEFEEIFTPARGVAAGWKEFYNKYPGSNGYVGVTDVGFDSGRTQALVYASRFGGGTDGVGRYYFLTRGAGGWVVNQQVDVWYS
jgi:hypothetical protein